MYQAQGQEAEFYDLKPQLTSRQLSLMSAFNQLSQERQTEQGAPFPIKEKSIRYYQRFNGSYNYAPDLFIMGIRLIDNEYITQQCEEMRRKANRGK